MPPRLSAEQGHPLDRRFYSTISIIVPLIIFAGFANTYGPKLVHGTSIGAMVHVHAAIFASWLLAFTVQTLLILNGRVALHRRVGNLGVALSFVLLVSASFTAIASARDGHLGIPGVEFPTPEGFLLLNLSSAVVFVILVVLGWVFRSKPQSHKRFMLMATVAGLAPPGIARLPLLTGHEPAIAGFVLLLIGSGPLYDWATRGRPHRAYLLSLPWVILILPPVVAALSATSAWQVIAAGLISSH